MRSCYGKDMVIDNNPKSNDQKVLDGIQLIGKGVNLSKDNLITYGFDMYQIGKKYF